MPRVVMLEFSDNDEANEFVRSHNDPNEQFTIAAVVAMPKSNFVCRCATPDPQARRRRGNSAKNRAWSRGKRYGWWLCTACRRPSKAIVRHFITNLLAGNNDLLPEILGEGDPVSPHNRWMDEGGTDAAYRKGLPTEKRGTYVHV